jgi:hypothetical protein
MKFVTLELRPRVVLPRATDAEMRDFTARLSLRECATVCDIVACELARRGLRRVQVGGRFYCAVEARICADLIAREVDLSEVAAQIEEARWECPEHFLQTNARIRRDQPQHSFRNHQIMPKTKSSKAPASFTPTPLLPQTGPREFKGALFRDDTPKREPKKEEGRSQPDIKLLSDAALNAYASSLNVREREAVGEMIRNEMQRLGFPRTSRIGGSIWLQARKNVLSGLKQFEVDVNEARGEMEAAGCNFGEGTDGVILTEKQE